VAHKLVFPKGSDENKFIDGALKSGTMLIDEIVTVLLVSRLTSTPVFDVQSKYMDCKVGVQQVFRRMAGEEFDT